MGHPSRPITAQEFRERLIALCLGGGSGLPKRSRDHHILLASATLWMETGAVYTASEVNAALSQWRESVCFSIWRDAVTLRRELVDNRYLMRDDSGSHYSPGPGPSLWRFDDAIAGIDPEQIMQDSRAARDARKSEFLQAGSES